MAGGAAGAAAPSVDVGVPCGLRIVDARPVILRSGSCRGLAPDGAASSGSDQRAPPGSQGPSLELFCISFHQDDSSAPRSVLRSFDDVVALEAALRAECGSALKASVRSRVKDIVLGGGPSQRRARVLGFLFGCVECPAAARSARLHAFLELGGPVGGSLRSGSAAPASDEGERGRPASAPPLQRAAEASDVSERRDPPGDANATALGLFGCLPHDLLEHTLSQLGHRDLCRLGQTSRALRAAAEAPEVWRRVLAARFGVADVGGTPAACGGSWKRAFAETLAGPPELFVAHRVQRRDTIAGLALRYRATTGEIRRANNILSEATFRQREAVLVPLPPAAMAALLRPEEAAHPVPRLHYNDAAQRYTLAFVPSQLACSDLPTPSPEAEAAAEAAAEARRRARLVRTLGRSMGLSEGEASYYLASHEYDLKHAVSELRQDEAWERQVGSHTQAQRTRSAPPQPT